MYTHKNRIQSSESTDIPESSTGIREKMRSTASDAWDRTDHLVRDYPASSALAMFSMGCCLGMLAAWLVMPAPRQRRWFEMGQGQWPSGRRLVQAVEQMPRTVSNYFSR
jgi:hypothetical protein